MAEAIVAMLGLGFAAFVIWLTVRIINRRERWAMWLAVVLLVYSLSFWPACSVASHSGIGRDCVATFYLPIFLCWANGPAPLANALDWWMRYCGATSWYEPSVDQPECILIRELD